MIVEYAFAKLNLALDVVRKRNDGFHDLKMIMVPLELSDILTFEESEDIILESSVSIENNAILKTVHLIKEMFNVTEGVKIKLEKRIPIGAGLGGGSADIAATVRGLNQLWNLSLSTKTLEEICLKLGSDTLFCLHNKTAYVYGRGDNMLFIPAPPIKSVFLIYPEISVSTKEVFSNHQIEFNPKMFNQLFTLYVNEKYQAFFKKTYNVLTKTTHKLYPEISQLERKILKISKNARMSGSGSTVYIPVFNEKEDKITKKCEKLPYKVLKIQVKR